MQFDWQQLARTEAHWIRIAVIDLLGIDGGRAMSSTEIAYELGQPLPNVSYHVNALIDAGSLKQVASRQVRGAVERFYSLDGCEDSAAVLRKHRPDR